MLGINVWRLKLINSNVEKCIKKLVCLGQIRGYCSKHVCEKMMMIWGKHITLLNSYSLFFPVPDKNNL